MVGVSPPRPRFVPGLAAAWPGHSPPVVSLPPAARLRRGDLHQGLLPPGEHRLEVELEDVGHAEPVFRLLGVHQLAHEVVEAG